MSGKYDASFLPPTTAAYPAASAASTQPPKVEYQAADNTFLVNGRHYEVIPPGGHLKASDTAAIEAIKNMLTKIFASEEFNKSKGADEGFTATMDPTKQDINVKTLGSKDESFTLKAGGDTTLFKSLAPLFESRVHHSDSDEKYDWVSKNDDTKEASTSEVSDEGDVEGDSEPKIIDGDEAVKEGRSLILQINKDLKLGTFDSPSAKDIYRASKKQEQLDKLISRLENSELQGTSEEKEKIKATIARYKGISRDLLQKIENKALGIKVDFTEQRTMTKWNPEINTTTGVVRSLLADIPKEKLRYDASAKGYVGVDGRNFGSAEQVAAGFKEALSKLFTKAIILKGTKEGNEANEQAGQIYARLTKDHPVILKLVEKDVVKVKDDEGQVTSNASVGKDGAVKFEDETKEVDSFVLRMFKGITATPKAKLAATDKAVTEELSKLNKTFSGVDAKVNPGLSRPLTRLALTSELKASLKIVKDSLSAIKAQQKEPFSGTYAEVNKVKTELYELRAKFEKLQGQILTQLETAKQANS